MTKFAGLDKIAPDIIKFPFVKTFKAIINLKLQRKIGSSIARICALTAGLAIGYIFPEIGSFMSFFVNLFIANPLNPLVLNTISIAASMVLSASVMMFITKKLFNYYNTQKYGVSNSELRLTERNRKLLNLKFTLDGLSKEKVNKRIQQIEDRIHFLVNKITLYKLSNDYDLKTTAKVALNGLKRGDISFFLVNYEVDFARHNKRMSDLKKFKQGNPDLDMTNFDSYGDDKYDIESTSSESRKSSDDEKEEGFGTFEFDDDFDVINNLAGKKPPSSNHTKEHTDEEESLPKRQSKKLSKGNRKPFQNNNTVTFTVNLYGMKKGDTELGVETSIFKDGALQSQETKKTNFKI